MNSDGQAHQSVLVVDDDLQWLKIYTRGLSQLGFRVNTTTSPLDALYLIAGTHVDVAIVDLKMLFPSCSSEFGGLELLSQLRADAPEVPVIVASAYGTSLRASEVMRRGAFHYLEKPPNWKRLRAILQKAILARRQYEHNASVPGEMNSKQKTDPHDTFREKMAPGEASPWALADLGTSRAINAVTAILEPLAGTNGNILLVGEPGSGKEFLARAVHHSGGYSAKQFIRLSCAVHVQIPGPSLTVSTAPPERQTRTVFLDHLDEMSSVAQVKLLEILDSWRDSGAVRPFMLVSSSRTDLTLLTQHKKFDAALANCLSGTVIAVPALRDRRDGKDLPLLIGYHLRQFGRQIGVDAKISADAMKALLAYDFPGNIRELENMIAKAMATCGGEEIRPADLDFGGAVPAEQPQVVFMCHNSSSKAEVRRIGNRLRKKGIRPWLDEDELRPGLPWQRRLEELIANTSAAAVFVGESGIGPWQDVEIGALLREFVRRGCPVIPVIMQDCRNAPELPLFLSGMMWVDFRKKHPDPLEQLVFGIKGFRE